MDSGAVVLVICAMDREYTALINKVRLPERKIIAGIEGTMFPIPGGKAFAIHGEIGKVATAFVLGRLSSVLNIKAIINSGVAGSLCEKIHPLDVVVSSEVAFHDVDLTAFGNQLGQYDNQPLWFKAGDKFISAARNIEHSKDFEIVIGPIISGDKFVTKDNLPKKLVNKFGKPLAVDMEGGSVAMCSRLINVPFVVIRCISDDTTKENNKDNYQEFLELAAKHASSVTLWLLNSLGEN